MQGQKHNFFNYRFSNQELMEEFEEMIDKIPEPFTYVNRISKNFNVAYLDALSVTNNGAGRESSGRYHSIIIELANSINKATTVEEDISMTESFLTIISHARSFQKLMNEYERINKTFASLDYNEWNIVWYDIYRPVAQGKRSLYSL